MEAPFSHSLPGAATIALLIGLGVAIARLRGGTRSSAARSGMVHGALVLSHWLLDLLVIELPVAGPLRAGLALAGAPAFALEVAVLGAGLTIWWGRAEAVTRPARVAVAVLTVGMVALLALTFSAAPPSPPLMYAISTGSAYAALAALAGVLDYRARRRCQDVRAEREERV